MLAGLVCVQHLILSPVLAIPEMLLGPTILVLRERKIYRTILIDRRRRAPGMVSMSRQQ